MAGDSIAKLSVQISANAQPFDQTLEGVSTKLQQFAGVANSLKAGNLGGIVQQFGTLGGLNLSRPLEAVGNLLSHVPGWVGVAGGALSQLALPIQEAAQAFAALVDQGRKSFKELDDIRKKYGLTGEAAAGLRLAVANAGMTMEEAAGPLGRIQRALGQAGAGSAEAQRHFRQLGLDGLALSRMPLNDSLQVLARRFKEIKDPNEKAAAAAQIFGRNWQEGVKLLEKLEDQARFQAIARNFGAVATAADMARFQRHKESGQELGTRTTAAQQGFTQQLFSLAAPILTFIQDVGSRAMDLLGPVIAGIMLPLRTAAQPLVVLIALIEGAAETLKPLWDEMLKIFEEIGTLAKEIFGDSEGGLVGMFKEVGKWAMYTSGIFWIIKLAVEIIGKTVRDVIGLIKQAQNLASNVTFGLIPKAGGGAGSNSGGPGAERAAALSQLREEIGEQVRTLGAQTDALGGASNAMQIYQLQLRGAANVAAGLGTPAFQDFYRWTERVVEATRRGRSALDELREAHTANAVATANQQLRDQAEQLLMTAEAWRRYQLIREGATAAELAATERLQFRNQVIQAVLRNQQNTQTAGAGANMGSREALMAVSAFQRAGEQRSLQEQIRDAIFDQRETNRATAENTAAMRRAMEGFDETRERPGWLMRAFEQAMGPEAS